MTEPKICEFEGKLLAGVRRRMSLADDRTSEIWREFRSREKEVQHRVGKESYSLKVYDTGHSLAVFAPAVEFDKWAAAHVTAQTDEFESVKIPPGKYAVFVHHGTPADASRTFGYIFGQWLPGSGFELDERPHFEVLPEDYSPFDPNAEEEIWIPIREI